MGAFPAQTPLSLEQGISGAAVSSGPTPGWRRLVRAGAGLLSTAYWRVAALLSPNPLTWGLLAASPGMSKGGDLC